eukprot:9268443-Lingulodinium_polyedra.AAC.1
MATGDDVDDDGYGDCDCVCDGGGDGDCDGDCDDDGADEDDRCDDDADDADDAADVFFLTGLLLMMSLTGVYHGRSPCSIHWSLKAMMFGLSRPRDTHISMSSWMNCSWERLELLCCACLAETPTRNNLDPFFSAFVYWM